MLDSFAVQGAERCTLVLVCVTWLPCGCRGMLHGLFWLRTGTLGVSPAHWCLSGLTDVVRELLIGLCSVLLSYILTTAVSGVVCWCRTNFNTGTYQAHFSFPPLSVEIMGHCSIVIMNRRSTHHFFLYIGYFRLPSGLSPLEPKWYHYTNTLLWIHTIFWLSDQLHNSTPILNVSFQLFHGFTFIALSDATDCHKLTMEWDSFRG